MEIRHLKDRMVRKCKKLAKTTLPISKKSSRDDSFSFQTFIAPADFRVKEMEKWFRDQQQRALSLPRRPTVLSGNPTSALEPSSSKLPIQRSLTNPEQSTKQKSPVPHKATHGILSPPPLPVLLLSHREEYGLDDPVQQVAPHSDARDQQSNAAESNSRPLQRRPSCIKRNSLTELKTVSWADNQEWDAQVDSYAAAAREAQASGERYGLFSAFYFWPPASLIAS